MSIRVSWCAAVFAIGSVLVLSLFPLAPASEEAQAPADEKSAYTPQQQEQLDEAVKLDEQVVQLYGQGKYVEAIKLCQQALAIFKEVLGEKHLDYATSLTTLSLLYQATGDYANAEPLLRQALAIKKDVLGEKHPDYAESLSNLAALYYAMGDYAKAEPRLRQALTIRKEVLGEKHPDYAASLNSLAVLYQATGHYAKAEPLCRQALAIRKETLGEKHPDYATSLDNLAELYDKMGDYPKAEPLLRQALAIRKESLGEKHPDYTTSLNNLAALYYATGDYAKAEPLLRQALAIRKEVLGEKHFDYAVSLSNLALLYQATGDYAKAEPLLRQALAIDKEVLGEKHPNYATGLNNIAALYKEMGEYAKAEPLYRQALAIRKEALGEMHPDYAASLNNLATVYEDLGDFAKAEVLYQQASAISREVFGDRHHLYATSLNNLAGLYKEAGEYAKAARLYRQALAIDKEALGEKHPDYAGSLSNLAVLYQATGDYAKAEPLLRQALAIDKEVLGEKHPSYNICLNNLANLYLATGDFAKAKPLYQQALAIDEQLLGDKHSQYAADLYNLARLYEATGDYAMAEPLCRQASTIWKEVLGEKHPYYAASLHELATLYEDTGDYANAEPFLRELLSITTQSLGKRHPSYAVGLSDLASLYFSTGDYAKAEPLLQKAMAINKEVLGEKHPDYALSLNNLAALYDETGDYAKAEPLYRQALAIRKEILGEKHPLYAASLNNLAMLYQETGDCAKAEPLAQQALKILQEQLELTAVVQSERQQLRMADTVRGYLYNYLCAARGAGMSADQTYAEVLAWKGTVSARQQAMRRMRIDQQDPIVANLFNQLADTARQLDSLSRATPKPEKTEQFRQKVEQLNGQYESLQQQISAASAEYRQLLKQQNSTSADLQHALPSDAVLVDFLEYHHKEAPKEKGQKPIWEQRLTAFVVRPQRPIEWIELGPSKPICEAVDHWRQSYSLTDATELRRLVWQPLEEKIAGAKTVIVSPDGALDRFPLAALPGKKEGAYLIEDVAIATVAIPRLLPDVLAENSRSPAASLLTVGDVNFETMLETKARTEELSMSAPLDRDGNGWRFPPLPGTKEEIAAIENSFGQRFPGGQHESLRQQQATKQAVRVAMPHYGYLHLATHGFFAPPDRISALQNRPEQDLKVLASPRVLGVEEQVPSTFGGIGVVPEHVDEKIKVKELLPKGAAAVDGRLRPGDQIVAVAQGDEEWTSLDGKTIDEAMGLIRGPVGSKLRLRVQSAASGAPAEYELTRKLIALPGPVDSSLTSHQESQISGYHPDLLVGLALAGANQQAEPGQDDGILTALEVGSLDLHAVQIVVLSACETGLGQTAGGEGVLGLQRAFQLAGAKTTVTSLWSVNDTATQMLMTEFYKHLWDRDHPLGTLEALRQAQLEMLHHYDPRSGQLRGLEQAESRTESNSPRLSPKYWAAFELSGDWR